MQLVYNIFFGLLYFVIFTSFYSKYRQNDIMIPNTYILKKNRSLQSKTPRSTVFLYKPHDYLQVF